MSSDFLLIALLSLTLGLIIGGIAGVWLGRRREQALAIELAVASSHLKAQEQLEAERVGSLERAMERLTANFDTVAGRSLRWIVKLQPNRSVSALIAARISRTENPEPVPRLKAPPECPSSSSFNAATCAAARSVT